MTMAVNLHEVRRRATREALRSSALELFRERGFDEVNVSDIAGAAGVTERTFYRHFATKESVLFQDYQNRLEWLAAALDVRPADESLFDAIRVAVRSFPHDLEIVRQAATLRNSLISGERVSGHLRVVQASFAAVLTDFVRERHASHPDVELGAIVTGSVVAAALVGAVEVWGLRCCVDDVGGLVERSLELVRTGLAGFA
jgi:AcrR family transcriptional regulator